MNASGSTNTRRIPRWIWPLAICYLLGIFSAVGVAWLLSASVVNLLSTKTLNAVADDDANVSLSTEEGFGTERVTVSREYGRGWAPMRAAGPPDTPTMGDRTSAWASLTQDGQQEWLELDYPTVAHPMALHVYETLSPGAVVRATVFDPNGNEIEAWRGADPGSIGTSGVWLAKIPLRAVGPTSRVRIYIDSMKVSGWNEIDAVGMVGSDGAVTWARAARASSTYATATAGGGITLTPAALEKEMPSWIELDPINSSGVQASSQTRVITARGWPMLALYGDVQQPPVPMATLYLVGSPAASSSPNLNFPYRPIWAGLFVDGLVYGGVVFLLYLSTARFRRMLLDAGRMRRGCCMKCGYDLRYDFAAGCPECGWNRLPERMRQAELGPAEIPTHRF